MGSAKTCWGGGDSPAADDLRLELQRPAQGTPEGTSWEARERCAPPSESGPAWLRPARRPPTPPKSPVSPEEVRPVARLPAIMPFLQPGLDLGVTLLLRICPDT